MHNRIVGIAVLIVTSCAPRVTQSATAFDPQAANALAADTMRQIEAKSKEMANARQANMDRQLAESIKQRDVQKQAEAAARNEREAKLYGLCGETRLDRVNAALALIPGYLAEVKRLAEATRKIGAVCKISTVATGAMNVQRSGNSSRIYPEMRGEIKCSGPVPMGLTKEQAWEHLQWAQQGSGSDEMLSESGSWASANRNCAADDTSVGLDLAVRTSDLAAMQKVIAWEAPSTADASIPVPPPPAH